MGTTDANAALAGKRVLITGGAGLLGKEHAAAVVGAGGEAILVDLDDTALNEAAILLRNRVDQERLVIRRADVTNRDDLETLRHDLENTAPVDAVINNAAINPTMSGPGDQDSFTFENYPLEAWNREFEVGLPGFWRHHGRARRRFDCQHRLGPRCHCAGSPHLRA